MGKLREVRKHVVDILAAADWRERLEALEAYPPKVVIGPLYACLLDADETIRWRAVAGFGVTVSRMAATKMEDARGLMRQFMWRLNEESGNIAWGIPEAFGEVLAVQPELALEFHRVLASYIKERPCESGDNYLELCPLRRGVYWGLGRLAQARPELALPAFNDLALALQGDDAPNRGLAAWALGPLLPLADARAPEMADAVRAKLLALGGDETSVELFSGGSLRRETVGALARQAAGG